MTGSLEVITGPMYSGKSDLLIRRFYEIESTVGKLGAYKPSIETRDNGIESRTGLCIPATPVHSLYETNGNPSGYAIDEAHMFSDAAKEVAFLQAARAAGKSIIVSCIDIDYMGKQTEILECLYDAEPDSVTVLTANCNTINCEDAATYTALYRNGLRVLNGDQIVVEDRQKVEEIYSPMCADHFR